MRYNKQFQKWFAENYGKAKILEKHTREFIQTYIKDGKSTQVLVAALKFRFNECEKRSFSFKGLIRASQKPKKHSYISREKRESIDKSLEDNLDLRIACRLLYELGARCQDLLQLKYNSFKVED